MVEYVVKVVISAGLIVAVAETAKASPRLGGLLASLPLVSLLGMIWLFWDTGDKARVADLSMSVFWLVLPSLPMFLVLPWLLKRWPFVPSLLVSVLVLLACYGVTLWVLSLVSSFLQPPAPE